LNEVVEWNTITGSIWIPIVTGSTWSDEETPWAVFTAEEVVYNVDVQEYIQQNGL
jgi:hypothetical protein